MATVYLADDLKHGRKVAIKVMRPDLVAAVGQLYYVMPFITGKSLRNHLEREKQLPLEDALRLTREIASALGYAHHPGSPPGRSARDLSRGR